MAELLLGIDIGTFETKGVLVDASGVVRARARRRHGIATPAPGWVEHDADAVWWADFAAVARELTAAVGPGDRIAGVGASGIGPCVLPVDADLRPLRPAILYGVDTRAQAEIDELTELLGEDELLSRSGNVLTSQSSGPKVLWVERHEPEVAARTRWYLTCESYLVARLTGEVVMDRATAGYFHPLYDAAADEWAADLAGIVAREKLPRLAWSHEVVGRVTDAAAVETGIPAGTPVVAGAADAPSEALAASVAAPGDMMLMYGSSTFMIRVADRPISDRVLWSAPFLFPGTYVVAGGTSTAGTATRWVCDALGLDPAAGDDALFAELVALASTSPPGARGVLALPHLSGERTPVHDPDARGAFVGISLDTDRGDLARALIEGIAHSVAHALDAYESAALRPDRLVAIGGGTKNPILTQTVSDLTGLAQEVADSDGAALGDAILAALGVGLVASPRDAAAWIRMRDGVTPGDAAGPLRADHADYVELYRALAPLNARRASRRTP